MLTVVKSFITGFLRRPRKFGSTFLIVLSFNVKTKGKVEPNFYGLLRIHELYKNVPHPIQNNMSHLWIWMLAHQIRRYSIIILRKNKTRFPVILSGQIFEFFGWKIPPNAKLIFVLRWTKSFIFFWKWCLYSASLAT